MLLPVSWLKKYVDIDKSTKEIADKITDSGSHVESIISPKGNMSGVVLGVINKIEKHPNADRLLICAIDIGDEVLQIVTGAPNVFEGAYVPVAKIGATLHGDMKIKESDFRGVPSHGMLCSLEELGLDVSVIPREQRDGIYIFNEEYPLGSDVFSLLDLDSEVIEIELTPNRPDCISILGMSRETAATFGLKLNKPEISIKNEVEDISKYFKSIEIESKNCNRFYGRVVKDVTIKPSPIWMQNALISAGVRPISNIVDVTNYVMLELGQPLHSYDLNTLKEGRIVVRDGVDGEVFKTLDNQERLIKDTDLLITDGVEIIGLAGIMGGLDSEITDSTKKVFLEGANFDSETIRLTSKRLGLRTEASMRFEKGVDVNLSKLAVDRAAQLIEEIGAGTVVGSYIDTKNYEEVSTEIKLREEKCNSLSGLNLSISEMADYLNSLEIETEIFEDYLIAKIPSFRSDLEIEEDLIEEITRLYGFHNIEPKNLVGEVTRGGRSKLRNTEFRVKDVLLAMGYSECTTFSFISPKAYDSILLNKDSETRDNVVILNPLGEEFSVMRRSLVPNMLDILSRNYNHKNENFGGFEFGKIFIPVQGDLPLEKTFLTIGSYGMGDFYYIKESVEKALWTIGIENLVFKRDEVEYLHPGITAGIYLDNKKIGIIGEVHPLVMENYSIKAKSYIANIDFEVLLDYVIENYKHKPIVKFPAISRDFAFVLDRDIDVYELEQIAIKEGSELLESFRVFDIYTGESLGEDKKSVAFTLTFRHSERTLKDEEIQPITEKIVQSITENLGGNLRS